MLVSLAVKVLQKNSVCGLFVFVERSDLNNASLSNCIKYANTLTLSRPLSIAMFILNSLERFHQILTFTFSSMVYFYFYNNETVILKAGPYRRNRLKGHLSIYFICFWIRLRKKTKFRHWHEIKTNDNFDFCK